MVAVLYNSKELYTILARVGRVTVTVRAWSFIVVKFYAVTIDPVTVKIANWPLIRQPEQ